METEERGSGLGLRPPRRPRGARTRAGLRGPGVAADVCKPVPGAREPRGAAAAGARHEEPLSAAPRAGRRGGVHAGRGGGAPAARSFRVCPQGGLTQTQTPGACVLQAAAAPGTRLPASVRAQAGPLPRPRCGGRSLPAAPTPPGGRPGAPAPLGPGEQERAHSPHPGPVAAWPHVPAAPDAGPCVGNR